MPALLDTSFSSCWVNTPVLEALGKHTCELWMAEVLHSLLSSSGLWKNPYVYFYSGNKQSLSLLWQQDP